MNGVLEFVCQSQGMFLNLDIGNDLLLANEAIRLCPYKKHSYLFSSFK